MLMRLIHDVGIASALSLLVIIGCSRPNADDAHAVDVRKDPNAWTVESLMDDRGHDTLVAEDGSSYHDYYFAIVLSRGDERLRLDAQTSAR